LIDWTWANKKHLLIKAKNAKNGVFLGTNSDYELLKNRSYLGYRVLGMG
jgi:hypothetical protein